MSKLWRNTLLALLLCLALPAGLMAQTQASTGQIAGTVTDSTGAVVPNATVKVSAHAIGVERSMTTNAEGLYRFVLLPAGTYTLEATAPNFASQKLQGVQVQVGRTVDLAITLGLGKVEQTVEVATEGVQVTTEHADSLVTEAAIVNLPINGRRFQDFVTLTPTAQVEPSRNQISLSGQRGINSNINIDGMDYNQPFFGGIRGGERSTASYTVPQESIREFQVVNAGYAAEFGRSTGGLVTAITKSGTNNFHGSAFYLNRDKSLARGNEYLEALAASPSANGREITIAPTRHQWGGSIGGPLKKDKLFVFGTYEGQKENQNREVLFSNLSTATRTAANAEAYDYYAGLQGGYQQTNDAWAYLAKVDWQANDANRLNVRYNQSYNEGKNSTTAGTALTPTTSNAITNNGTEKDRTYTVVGQLSSILSPTMANELRAQWTKEIRPREPNALMPNVSTAAGQYGTVTFLPTTQSDYRVQIADNISTQIGKHTIKFGAELNYVYANQTFAFNQFGSFSLSGGSGNTTTAQLAAMSLVPGGHRFNLYGRNPSGVTTPTIQYRLAVGNGLADMDSKNFAGFIQDSWKVLPTLTINAGLRYEGTINPQPDVSNTAMYNTVTNFQFPRGIQTDPANIPNQLQNWGPRVGFAWDPFNNGKTVVRGFGGIYYASTPLLLYSGPINNYRETPGDLSITLPFTVSAANPNKTLYQQFLLAGINLDNYQLGELPILTVANVQQIATALGLSPVVWNGSSPMSVSNDYKDPRSVQAGLGVEREVISGLTLGLDFNYVNTSRLQRNRDINLATPTVDAASGRLMYGSRPLSSLFQVQYRESSARSLYRAATFRANLRKRYALVNFYYTLGETTSDDDNERDSGGPAYDSIDALNREYSFSRLDTRHQILANPVVFLPWGFEVSSAMRIRSGRPFNALIASSYDANGDGARNDRPMESVGVIQKRNSFRQPWQSNVDLRVQKTFSVREGMKVKTFADFFNVFNVMNLQYAGNSLNYCTSGSVSCGLSGATNTQFMQLRNPTTGVLLTNNTPGEPWQAQLGVRLEF